MTDPTDGGTVRYHRADYQPHSDRPWKVWFTAGDIFGIAFTAEQGEAMGLTPPEPAPLVVTCNGHSIDVPEWELDDFIAEWGEDGIEDYSAVTVTDPDTGEVLGEQVLDNDYVVICAGNRYVAHTNAHANGTHVLTIKRESAGGAK